MTNKATPKAPVDLYVLQEKWLLACADFDQAKSIPKRKAAVGRMQRVLRSLHTCHPRELAPYRSAYERRLEKMAGVRLPRHEDAPKKKHASKTAKHHAPEHGHTHAAYVAKARKPAKKKR